MHGTGHDHWSHGSLAVLELGILSTIVTWTLLCVRYMYGNELDKMLYSVVPHTFSINSTNKYVIVVGSLSDPTTNGTSVTQTTFIVIHKNHIHYFLILKILVLGTPATTMAQISKRT